MVLIGRFHYCTPEYYDNDCFFFQNNQNVGKQKADWMILTKGVINLAEMVGDVVDIAEFAMEVMEEGE